MQRSQPTPMRTNPVTCREGLLITLRLVGAVSGLMLTGAPVLELVRYQASGDGSFNASVVVLLACIRFLIYGIVSLVVEARIRYLTRSAPFLSSNQGRAIFYLWVACDIRSTVWTQLASDEQALWIGWCLTLLTLAMSLMNVMAAIFLPVAAASESVPEAPAPVANPKKIFALQAAV